MAKTNIYALIAETIEKSKESVDVAESQLTLKIFSDLLNNASSGLSDIFNDYAKYNDVMTHHSDRYIYSQAALSGLGLICNTLQNIQARRAYGKGPNGLITQYLNSIIASQALDPDELQLALVNDKIIDQTHHTIGQGAVKVASNDATKHATNAQTQAANAKTSADQAKTDMETAQKNSQELLEKLQEDSKIAEEKLAEITQKLEKIKAIDPSQGTGSQTTAGQ